jgi:hypothetical protein
MHSERVEVLSYAGRRGYERPTTFILHGLRIDVVEILEHRIEEGFQDRVLKRYFKVKGSDGNIHRISYDESVEEWFYAS